MNPSTSASRSPLLAGVTVLELGTMVTAPLAGRMLADLGARVIKIENPAQGDPFRRHATGHDSPQFCAYNHGKESVALNLRETAGRAALLRMLESADVLIDNFRPGVLARLGLDDATLCAVNPRLVRCSITGFGRDGPYAQRPAYDSVALALSGVAALTVDPANPFFSGPTIADNVTGMYACYGVLGALYRRSQTGEGARIEINMLDASVAFIPDCIAIAGNLPGRITPHTRVAISQAYAVRCADEQLLALHLSSSQDNWLKLLGVLDRQEWQQDPRFASPASRASHFYVLNEMLGEAFRARPLSHWLSVLEAADLPHAPIRNVAEIADDPQLQHLGTLEDITSTSGTSYTAVRTPVLVDGVRPPIGSAPPTLGQHTEAVLAEFSARAPGGE